MRPTGGDSRTGNVLVLVLGGASVVELAGDFSAAVLAAVVKAAGCGVGSLLGAAAFGSSFFAASGFALLFFFGAFFGSDFSGFLFASALLAPGGAAGTSSVGPTRPAGDCARTAGTQRQHASAITARILLNMHSTS